MTIDRTPIQQLDDAIRFLKCSNQQVLSSPYNPLNATDAAKKSINEALASDADEVREILYRLLRAVYRDWHAAAEVRSRFAMNHQPCGDLECATYDLALLILRANGALPQRGDTHTEECIHRGEN